MERSGERVRVSFIEREIREVQRKLDELLHIDHGLERRIQRLEDLKIEGQFSSVHAKIQQLQYDSQNRKITEQTRAWFWGKIAGFVTFVASIVVAIWMYVRGV